MTLCCWSLEPKQLALLVKTTVNVIEFLKKNAAFEDNALDCSFLAIAI